jgi:hypothetical protein
MTDRTMCKALAAALDGLTGAQRRFLKTIAAETKTPWMHGLLAGLVAEVVAGEMREVTELHAHELDRLKDVEEAAVGAVWPTEPEDRSKGGPCWPQGH